MALQVISYNVGPKIYPDKVDAAFADLGFEEMTVNGMSGYLAVRRKPEEIAALTRLMAQDAETATPKNLKHSSCTYVRYHFSFSFLLYVHEGCFLKNRELFGNMK